MSVLSDNWKKRKTIWKKCVGENVIGMESKEEIKKDENGCKKEMKIRWKWINVSRMESKVEIKKDENGCKVEINKM